jgi:hypothetical protein
MIGRPNFFFRGYLTTCLEIDIAAIPPHILTWWFKNQSVEYFDQNFTKYIQIVKLPPPTVMIAAVEKYKTGRLFKKAVTYSEDYLKRQERMEVVHRRRLLGLLEECGMSLLKENLVARLPPQPLLNKLKT